MDNAHDGIKTMCQVLGFSQLAEIAYDIGLHIIYSVNHSPSVRSLAACCADRRGTACPLLVSQTGKGSAGLQGVAGSESGSESYHDLRLASLVTPPPTRARRQCHWCLGMVSHS
jgi:hypothetical protein